MWKLLDGEHSTVNLICIIGLVMFISFVAAMSSFKVNKNSFFSPTMQNKAVKRI